MEQKKSATLQRPPAVLPPKTEPERQLGGPQSGFPPPYIVGCELAPYLIVGMDFGCNFCRVSTFHAGEAHSIRDYGFRALVEDVLGKEVQDRELAYSLKHCLAANQSVRKGGQLYSARDLTARFFRGVKQRIELTSDRLLAKAVISVPASFTHRQRSALITAATDADIAVLGLINDPSAAALDACYSKNLRNGRYLVVSSGVYTLEATIIDVQNKLVEVKAIRGSRSLSGNAVDHALAEAIAAKTNIGSQQDLIGAVNKAKAELSKGITVVEVGNARYSFDTTAASLWLEFYSSGVEHLVKGLMDDAGVTSYGLNGVILSGEATKLWLLTEVLQRKFKLGVFHTGEVAAGAAIYAALLVRQAKDWVLWDALATSVIAAQGATMKEVIAANSPLPINGHATLMPHQDGQAGAMILQRAFDNDHEFEHIASVRILEELPVTESGASVDLTVAGTANGTLSFSARHKALDVNLTVEVLEPEGESTPPIELDPVVPSTFTATIFHPGFSLEKIGAQWMVSSVADGTPADTAGIMVYDELLWIDDVHAFHANDVLSEICGAYGVVKRLTFLRDDSQFTVELECTVCAELEDESSLTGEVTDATISGDNRKLVRTLLRYARFLAQTRSRDDEGKSLVFHWPSQVAERAATIAADTLGKNDFLYLQSLCEVCTLEQMESIAASESAVGLPGGVSEPGEGAQKAELAQVFQPSKAFEAIREVLESNTELPAAAAKLLSDLATAYLTVYGASVCREQISVLIEHAVKIAQKHKLPVTVQNKLEQLFSERRKAAAQADAQPIAKAEPEKSEGSEQEHDHPTSA